MFGGVKSVTREGALALILDKGQESETKLERTLAQLIFDSEWIRVSDSLEFDTQVAYEANHPPPEISLLRNQTHVSEGVDPTPKFVVKKIDARPAIHAHMVPDANDSVFWFKGEQFGEELTHCYVEIYRGTEDKAAFHIYPETDEQLRDTGKMTLGLVISLRAEQFRHLFQALWSSRLAPPRIQIVVGIVCFQWPVEASFADPWHSKHYVVEAEKYVAAELRSVRVVQKTEATKVSPEPVVEDQDRSPAEASSDQAATALNQLHESTKTLLHRLEWIQIAVVVIAAILLLKILKIL
jgi:hypothetical protein